MTYITKLLLLLSFILNCVAGLAQIKGNYKAIYSGIPWFDDRGKVVSAHGACIVKEGSRYYLFGESHTDTSNAFAGFNCYSSSDLYNWKFERVALPIQPSGKLGSNWVGERVKVMKCPSTGEFIMYMHVDTLTYKDQFVGYATAKNITGPYTFKGPLLFKDQPIKKWDMGSFQDRDGAGYILLHGGDIYRLSEDYKKVSAQVCKSFDREMEAPTLFKKDSLYFFIGSHLSSWEKNDNYYYTATSLGGPWNKRGLLAPEGSLTWYSQSTFVFPIVGSQQTTYLYMGDRWSFPKQASAATYVWQPLIVVGVSLSMPTYWDSWKINTTTGNAIPVIAGKKIISNSDAHFISYAGNWKQDSSSIKSADEKGASCTISFTGSQIGFYGLSRADGGYAKVIIKNNKGKEVLSSIVDFYCKYPVASLKFLCPVLTRGKYQLTVSALRERGNWSDKRKSDYGSSGYFIYLDKVIIND